MSLILNSLHFDTFALSTIMNQITDIIAAKFPEGLIQIDSTKLDATSGDRYYLLPVGCNIPIVQFLDNGRQGYMIQIKSIDTKTFESMDLRIVVHNRYNNRNTAVYSGPRAFYPSNIIQDAVYFCDKLKRLLNGEAIPSMQFNANAVDNHVYMFGNSSTDSSFIYL